jgi:hypothetical protein
LLTPVLCSDYLLMFPGLREADGEKQKHVADIQKNSGSGGNVNRRLRKIRRN